MNFGVCTEVEQPSMKPMEIEAWSRPTLAAILFCIALVAIFWGFYQLDIPLTRYARSVRVPWLEAAGDIGNRLGSGAALVGVSGVFILLGVILKQAPLRTTGVESLIAHAIAGLTAQALKHLIGRPRPRLTHGETIFLAGPSFDPGLDSFPSGHAAASFAVATVLARRFPATSWLLYVMAVVVAVSRIVRGSHFPTDVLAGISLGILVGFVVAHPMAHWKQSLLEALTKGTPFLVATFAIVWIAVHPSFHEPMTMMMLAAGAILLVMGMGLRIYAKVVAASGSYSVAFSTLLILTGLGLTTGSKLVAGMALLIAGTYWLTPHHPGLQASVGEQLQSGATRYQAILTELPLAVVLSLAVLSIQKIRGILPLS